MVITRQMLAEKISAYLQGRQSLDELVAWAEDSMQEAEFDQQDFPAIRDVVARLGVADVAAFGLAWQDAVDMLGRLGYQATVGIHAVR
jgi:secreted Zn-dependent insulinase-like peptidase